jgi:hypothetical protein
MSGATVIARGGVRRRIDGAMFRRPLFVLAALPALYLFFAIQRGSLSDSEGIHASVFARHRCFRNV